MGQAPRGDTRQSAVLQAVRVQQVGSVLVSVGTCYTARESKITALPPKAFSLEEKDQPFWNSVELTGLNRLVGHAGL